MTSGTFGCSRWGTCWRWSAKKKMPAFLTLCLLALSAFMSMSIDLTDPALLTEKNVSHRGRQQVEPNTIWALELRALIGQVFQQAVGYHGEANWGAALCCAFAAWSLRRGGWLLVESPKPCQAVSWFLLGAAISICWALHPTTAPSLTLRHPDSETSMEFTLAVACHGGTFFALFPDAGSYIVGAFASIFTLHLTQFSSFHAAPNATHSRTWLDLFAGVLGGYVCSRYKKSSMGVLTAWAGSAALALSIHWWLCRTLLFLGRRDAKLYDTPAEHWLALVSDQNCCMAARYSFLMLWTALFVAARRIQTGTTKRTKKEEYNDWFQEQIRQAPQDCDKVPRMPGTEAAPALVPCLLDLPQESKSTISLPEQKEDCGMYLLPEDPVMRRSKTVPLPDVDRKVDLVDLEAPMTPAVWPDFFPVVSHSAPVDASPAAPAALPPASPPAAPAASPPVASPVKASMPVPPVAPPAVPALALAASPRAALAPSTPRRPATPRSVTGEAPAASPTVQAVAAGKAPIPMRRRYTTPNRDIHPRSISKSSRDLPNMNSRLGLPSRDIFKKAKEKPENSDSAN
ncbi:unnamed protein product [Effrenium voratum]|nr:unnamed protein product [Effrenium voratum]